MYPNPSETADLVTFTEKILNGNFIFFCSYRSEAVKILFNSDPKNHNTIIFLLLGIPLGQFKVPLHFNGGHF